MAMDRSIYNTIKSMNGNVSQTQVPVLTIDAARTLAYSSGNAGKEGRDKHVARLSYQACFEVTEQLLRKWPVLRIISMGEDPIMVGVTPAPCCTALVGEWV